MRCVFLEGEFPRKGDIHDIDRFFEVDESHEGTLNPDREDESDLLPSGSIPSSESVPLGTHSEAIFLRRSQRGNIPRRHFEIEREAFMCPQEVDEPKTYQEAMKSPTSKEWKLAMPDEMESMRKNQVWDLVDLPPGRKTIRNKWVLKVK